MKLKLVEIDPDAWDGLDDHADADWHSYSSGIYTAHSTIVNDPTIDNCKSVKELETKLRKLEFEFILEVSEFLQDCIRNWVNEYLIDWHPECFEEAERTFKAYLKNKEFSIMMKSHTSIYKLYFYLREDLINNLDFKQLVRIIKPRIEVEYADAQYTLSLANVDEIAIDNLQQAYADLNGEGLSVSFGSQNVKLTHKNFAYRYIKDDSIECMTSQLNARLEFTVEINGQLSTILGIDLTDAELINITTDQVIPQAHIKDVVSDCLQFGIVLGAKDLELGIQQAFDMAASQIDLCKDPAHPLGSTNNSNLGMIFANDFACYAKIVAVE